MATVDFEDCVVCQESLVDKMFPLFTTTTLSTQSLLAYKLNELLGLECLSGCCCRHCHDLVEQIDFFQQNMKGPKNELLARQQHQRPRKRRKTSRLSTRAQNASQPPVMKDSDAESSSSLVEIKADPLEEDEEDWPTASTVTQGFKTEAADSEDETWTPSSPFPNSLEAESRDSGGAFDSAEYDLFCLQYYPPDKMPRTLECSHCNHKSQTFQEKIKHQLRAHQKCKPFLCACDGATYLSCDQLRLHFVLHHDVEETANGFWKQEQLAELANMKPPKPIPSDFWKCEDCPVISSSELALQYHLRYDHEKLLPLPETCPFCSQASPDLIKHVDTAQQLGKCSNVADEKSEPKVRLRTRRLFDDPMEQCLEDGRINPELFLVKIDDPSRVPISDSLQRLLDQRVVYLKNPPRPANDLKDMLDFDLEAAKHGSLKFIPGLVQQNPSTDPDYLRSMCHCFACGEKFDRIADKIDHFIQDHCDQGPNYSCPLCQFSAPQESEASQHISEHKDAEIERRGEVDDFGVYVERGDDGAAVFQCQHCGLCSRTEVGLHYHLQLSHDDKSFQYRRVCELCSHRFRKGTSRHDKMSHYFIEHGGYTYRCPLCEKNLRREAFQIHVEKHLAREETLESIEKMRNQKFDCPTCLCPFSRILDLVRHLDKIHEKTDFPFTCPKPKCEALIPSINEYKMHTLNAHDELACELCGKVVKKHELPYHMEVHDDNAVFQCEACPKTFGTSYNMKKHFSRMHKNKKVLKRVLCSSGCGKLIVKERMAQHIRAVHLDHFSHKCEVCGMQFKDRRNWKKHSYQHTDEKPYNCSCGAGFIRKSQLTNHHKRCEGVKV